VTESSINTAMGPREWAMLVALSVLWGGAYFFVTIALKELPPLTIVVLRAGLAALTLHAILRVLGIPFPTDRRAWAAFFCMGFLNTALPFTLTVWAQSHLAGGVASILNATTPLFAVVVAHYWTRDEKITAGRLAGVIVGFAGVVVMISAGALPSLGPDTLAQLTVLAAALFYAIAGVYGRRFRAIGVEPLATAAGMLTAAAILLFPVMLIMDQPWTMAKPGFASIGSILGLAVLATALASTLYFRVLATSGATNVLLVTLLIPATAILLGAIFLGERLEPQHFAGMTLISLGLAAIDGRAFATLRRLVRGSRRALPESD
jgi:drug/metabolite transporter (DMT)-like permease